MATAAVSRKRLVSGSFLLGEQPDDCFVTPEELNREQRQIAQITREFACREVLPNIDAIEQSDFLLMRELLRRACESGIGNADISKQYGGSGLDQTSSSLIAEDLSGSGSFSASFAAHTGLGALPIVLFGDRRQKQKYLPKLARGESIAAFALTEASSGSDALNVATNACLSEDGQEWILDGQKEWVTNGSFADVFILFAKVDQDKFSAFIVERASPGLRIGPQQRKMSVRGSSACCLFMNHCRVPKENLLGEIGKGYAIAFNVLNIGRLRLGASSLGSAQDSLCTVLAHLKQRKAFGKSIADFGCTKEKIASMAAGLYTGRSMLYRTSGAMDSALSEIGGDTQELPAKVIEECAAECSMVKVWGSECLNYVVDEAIQMFGGAGFAEGHPAGRAYCDARVNRICEGTNEINRLIVAVWVLKRAINGKLRIGERMRRIRDEVLAGPKPREPLDGPMPTERALIENMRRATLMVVDIAWKKYDLDVLNQQEIIIAFADMFIEYYAADSAVRRAKRLIDQQGETTAQVTTAMSQLSLARSLERSGAAARKVIAILEDCDLRGKYSAMLYHLLNRDPFNTIALCQKIANRVIETDGQLTTY